MSGSLIPAVIGLVGVLVGAVITTGASYLLAVRKEKLEAAKDRSARARELKTAARLLANEFAAAKAAATLVERRRRVPSRVASDFSLEAWRGDKRILALELSYKDWGTVFLAVLAVQRLRDALAPPPGDNAVDTAGDVKHILRDIEAALEALTPYMG